MAYKARNREDLIAGIDEFLDEVIVLPPGEWDPNIRIEPPKKVPSADKRCVLRMRTTEGALHQRFILFVGNQKPAGPPVNNCKAGGSPCRGRGIIESLFILEYVWAHMWKPEVAAREFFFISLHLIH